MFSISLPGWLSKTLKTAARIMLAVLITALLTAVLSPFRSVLTYSTLELLFMLPAIAATVAWGLGSGVTAAITAFLAFNYFFISPYHTLRVHNKQDILALLMFLAVALLISQLIGRARAGQDAARDRELEIMRLYQLNTALAGESHPQRIGRILAKHSQESLGAARVEVLVAAASPEVAGPPDGGDLPTRPPTTVLPLQSARGLMGELRIWRSRALSPAEQRLMNAFAVQGALTLDRAALVQTENRAHLLEESDQLKSTLLSLVSHDLRTPLATIKASVTSLRSGEVGWDNDVRPELLAVIDEETDHLNYLVGNLLAMSRIESGALKPNRQWNLLSEIVNGVTERMRRSLEEHPLELDIPDDLPLAPLDYVQMEQVFTNLLSNSIKYAPPGTPIRITARALSKPPRLHVQVANAGPRVAAEHLERIFDKFYRVTDAERITGAGLGLSICKGIILAHGGEIWAENLPHGFAFNFITPLTLEGSPAPVVESDEI